MSIRSFKQLFSIVVSLILACLGLLLGFAIKDFIEHAPDTNIVLDLFKRVSASHPYYLSTLAGAMCALGLLSGAILGPIAAVWLINAGNAVEQMSPKDKIAVTVGTVVGIVVSLPFILTSFALFAKVPLAGIPLSILFAIAFIYLGIRATMSMKDEFRFIGAPPPAPEPEINPSANCKILDTNVIIDGRIADVCRTGFLTGPLYVPGFVLEELQHIADSGDSLKRARGRRGLDILNNMQKELPLIVRSWDKALDKSAQHDEVDTRLVKLAKALDGVIVTNDFNLNKVAALQGVQVLNVNELANALKPVVLPGEIMMVGIVKEGKEPNQGVAYLDDGTMIVVEDGRRFIGDTLGVVVTSVLQTVAGKMIFARVRSDEEGDAFEYTGRDQHRNGGDSNGNGAGRGDYSRRGPGKKVR
jgi:uncharacterized protein YacL